MSDFWTYRKYNSGIVELFGRTSVVMDNFSTGITGIYGKVTSLSFPSGLFVITPDFITVDNDWSFSEWSTCSCEDNSTCSIRMFGSSNFNNLTKAITLKIFAIGKYKL